LVVVSIGSSGGVINPETFKYYNFLFEVILETCQVSERPPPTPRTPTMQTWPPP
jgi:hypothetical protein